MEKKIQNDTWEGREEFYLTTKNRGKKKLTRENNKNEKESPTEMQGRQFPYHNETRGNSADRAIYRTERGDSRSKRWRKIPIVRYFLSLIVYFGSEYC
ncbi:hypothetical protein CEXT_563151 [Caerostris extrusa]|uniref:Uncharacterized protein n=1 Tax=Caerostris extrusa TaxID=172846 RepID=A0AAV4WDW9_CAEEX|nr:hypothetical protein CEXT_563151 [Caerostris extrusa]